ncbi:MAG: PD-(D/E)XK nuclease family protein [Candidatus Diapherotrites archaeon]|uniref:PD-(D/E)XK nuclease family protein n=1 Tax=Candidatus Iainarchaeum sp. TaxID=3101447 RepID=A0A8T4L6K8_9ARCH|nr:PD-(D/E)XK nuclease family protein [Candidatus Diapherotrites archaeon]
MTTYSHSRLSCFETCPLQFKWRYVEKREALKGEGIEAFMGSRVHEALEKLYKDALVEKRHSLEELLAFYGAEWAREWNDGIVIVKDHLEAEDYQKTGERCLRDYYQRYHPFDQARVLGIEDRVELDLGENVRLQGFLDRLDQRADGVYEIHDYKTGMTLPKKEALEGDRQLALYSIAVKERFPDAERVELVWHYLAFDKELRSTRTPEQLETLKAEVRAAVKAIEAEQEFPAKTSALCSWCEFQPECPKWKHLYKVEGLKPEEAAKETGVQLANRYYSLKKEADKVQLEVEALKEAIRDYAKTNNLSMLQGQGVKLSVNFYPRYNFPGKFDDKRPLLEEFLKAVGKWEDVQGLDLFALSDVMKSRAWPKPLLEQLERFGKKGETTYIRVREENREE